MIMSKRRESYLLDERRVDLCNYRMKNSEDSLTAAEDCLEKDCIEMRSIDLIMRHFMR